MIERSFVQERLKDMLRLHKVPSVSVTVYHKGNYEHYTAGYKDIETQTAPEPDTRYAIGSCTKSFTAGAIAILCDKGLLDLDAPVRNYIPEFEMYDPYVSTHLTIRDMLCHRCGLPRHELAWYPRLQEFTEESMLAIFRHLEPNQPFRYKMQYQNMMYALAGFVVSRVSGMPWADFIENYLIKPMELGVVSYDADDLLALSQHAKGYRMQPSGDNKEVSYATLGPMDAAGSMGMSSAQLAAWNVLLMHEGIYHDKQIISKEMVQEMTSPQMIVSDPIAVPLKGCLTMQSYGLGLFVENYRGHKVVQHSGHIDGFIADQCFLPGKDFACTVLTNSEAPFGARTIRYSLLDIILDAPQKNWVKDWADYHSQLTENAKASEKTVSDPNAPCPVSLDKICGEYHNPGYGAVTVTQNEDMLLLKLGTLTLEGRHCRNQYFIFTEDHVLTGALLEGNVELDIQGNVTGIAIKLDVASPKPVLFNKISK